MYSLHRECLEPRPRAASNQKIPWNEIFQEVMFRRGLFIKSGEFQNLFLTMHGQLHLGVPWQLKKTSDEKIARSKKFLEFNLIYHILDINAGKQLSKAATDV